METEQKEKETPEEWKSQQKKGEDLVRMYNAIANSECKIIQKRVQSLGSYNQIIETKVA